MNAAGEAAGAAGSAGLGAAAGLTMIRVAGMTAAGMVGGGAGIGAPAGPIGALFGAIAGLAIYGLVRVARDVASAGNGQVETGPDDDDGISQPVL